MQEGALVVAARGDIARGVRMVAAFVRGQAAVRLFR